MTLRYRGMPQPQDRTVHGVEADDFGPEEMAQTRRPEIVQGVEFRDGIRQLQTIA